MAGEIGSKGMKTKEVAAVLNPPEPNMVGDGFRVDNFLSKFRSSRAQNFRSGNKRRPVGLVSTASCCKQALQESEQPQTIVEV